MKTYFTDVLVIGSGATGLSAAIAAREAGKEVLVVSKYHPGAATCTAMSEGIFRVSENTETQERHLQLSSKTGRGLNEPYLLNVLVQESEKEVADMLEKGLAITRKPGSITYPANTPTHKGAYLVKALREYAAKIGVRFGSPVFIYDLAVVNNPSIAGRQVVGAWGIAKQTGQPAVFAANSVVLATGGAGALYQRTDNPNSITGDGYAMAARAGLPLIDLEFEQFYPLYTSFPAAQDSFLPPVIADVGIIINDNNEDLITKYNLQRPIAARSRDLACRAMALEGQVYLDFTGASEDVWKKAEKFFSAEETARIKEWFSRKYLRDSKVVPIAPASHFNMGGVVANSWGETGIKGLFAAGELMGGLHGANRLGGNALTETIVFGKRAGQRAALYSSREPVSSPEAIISSLAQESMEKLTAAANNNASSLLPSQLKKRVAAIMEKYVGVIKCRDGLNEALNSLSRLQQQPLSPQEGIVGMLEADNILLTARLMAESALYREESRGSHYRSDFPEEHNEAWHCHTLVSLVDRQIIPAKLEVGYCKD